MVREFLKKLNIIILSVCLLNISTSVAIAQVKVNEGKIQTDASGNKSKTVEYQFDEIQQKSLISTITMLGAGVFISRALVTYKPMTKDTMAAAVGGASFFGGEILSNLQLKKELDAISLQVEKGKDKDIQNQVKTFQDLKEGYQKVQKSLKTKKTLQMASAASFGVAGILAGVEHFKSHTGLTACKAAITKGMTAASSCAGNPTTSAECGKCALELSAVNATIAKYTATKDIPAESSAKAQALKPIQTSLTNALAYCPATGPAATTIGKGVSSVCSPVFASELKESSTGATTLKVEGVRYIQDSQTNFIVSHFKKSLIGYLTSFLFSNVQASWIPTIAGISGAILATLTATSKWIAKLIDPLMVTPKNRVVVWGIFAGMAYAASKSTDEVLKQIEERIKTIDQIIADLSKYESGIMGQSNSLAAGETGFIKSLGGGVNGIDTGSKYTTPCLDSNSTANCKPISQTVAKSLTSEYDLPEGLKSLVGQVGKLGDGLSGKSDLSSGTLAVAEGLGAKNAAIQKALKDQMQKVKKLTNSNPEAEGKKLLNKLNNATAKSVKSSGMTPSGFLAGMGGTPNYMSTDPSDPTDLLKDDLASGSLTAAVAPAIDLGNGKGEETQDFDFNFKGEGEAGLDLASSTNEEVMDIGEIPEDSIGRADGPTLFEILTSRYMKSGYPKLLEEDQEDNK